MGDPCTETGHIADYSVLSTPATAIIAVPPATTHIDGHTSYDLGHAWPHVHSSSPSLLTSGSATSFNSS